MSDITNAEDRIQNVEGESEIKRDTECRIRKLESKELSERVEDAGNSIHGTLNSNIERLASLLERINMGEYIVLLQNTRRLIFMNFACGLARGFGMILGMTALAAIFLILLSKIAALPFVPGYIARFIVAIQSQMSK